MGSFENKIILYNNDTCTWSNRAKVALNELGLPFEERTINVDGPRPAEFLKINPRGLVPVLIFNDEVVIESAIVCQFLCDIYPSHLCPPPTTTGGALRRAQISFFTDAYWSKFHTVLFQLFEARTEAETETIVNDAVEGLVREVEPLLADAKPFLGGSHQLTLAEVITGPFLIRALALSRHGVYPTSLNKQIAEKAPNFHRWANAVSSHPNITSVFNEEVIVERSWNKRARMRKAAGLTDWIKS
ncbi:putative Thioredoxin-like protein [Seiridium unicorne]|uniref:Thioredoxin-like protein n=1 Tax=Seiridium unicorne TaxID=138068 RepID=A0ABR2V3C5_9PEZI